MNSRNYETHVPPLASNTVTIATSSTGQGRLQQQFTGIRPLNSVPMRQVPIRKVVHDGGGGASTSSAQFLQIKEEVDDGFGTPTCSSGPLIASTSNSFQQYQRGGPTGGGGATVTSGALVMNSNGDRSSMAMDQPAPVNLAAKVAEVFLTAGHAFQKLGDLTLQLHTTTDVDESKWSEKEVDNLKNALTRFAHDLDQISSAVQNRSTRLVKNEIKRRHMLAADDSQQAPKRMQMSGVGGVQGQPTGTYTTVNSVGMMSGHAVPLGQKRLTGGGQTMGKLMAARLKNT
ncbi:hypothetical protein CRE_06041 [Caenorhabditis remanei]|uniref:Uncharacterized protein n=1 Tax=Caenorhabditis remanei TaxID=31234 RepID=E3N6I2_CAERE|nr:hypothetical protein CRE_06041 [Caenorhabditis remanei]